MQTSQSLAAIAYSLDGLGFECEVPLGSDLAVGSFVQVDTERGTRLGQLYELKIASEMSATLSGRYAQGRGQLIGSWDDGTIGPSLLGGFDEARLRPADYEQVREPLMSLEGARPMLEVGRMRDASAGRARVRAQGFSRHMFVCGQSGSGKTFGMGVLLEQLLLNTQMRIVVLDPNSDHVRLNELRPRDAVDKVRSTPLTDSEWNEICQRHGEVAKRMRIARSQNACDPKNAAQHALKIRAAEIGMEVLASLLDIDPIKDDELWDTLIAAGEKVRPGAPISELINIAEQMQPHGPTVARRLRVTGITSWPIWSSKTSSITDDLNDPEARLVVADLGSLDSEVERECVSLGVLRHLWAHRHERRPTLIVVDEAHNICPRNPHSDASARATELVTAIAAEGRKFGLHLLLATQRPA